MEYKVALSKAWLKLEALAKEKVFSVSFLSENYKVNLEKREIFSASTNLPAEDYMGILILHYLARKIKGLPSRTGEWISFKELEGGMPYYPAFKKRAIEPILKMFSGVPETLLEVSGKFKSKNIGMADVSAEIEVFENVHVLICLWRGDEEFGPEANMLFDANIKNIFCTEDVVVLGGVVASRLKR